MFAFNPSSFKLLTPSKLILLFLICKCRNSTAETRSFELRTLQRKEKQMHLFISFHFIYLFSFIYFVLLKLLFFVCSRVETKPKMWQFIPVPADQSCLETRIFVRVERSDKIRMSNKSHSVICLFIHLICLFIHLICLFIHK